MVETITLSSGENPTIDVHDDYGGTMEGVLIDQTASGAGATIEAEEGSWTIRNVGFKGVREGVDGQALRIAATGEGLVENVYLGDGNEGGSDANGVWCAGDHHSGTITLRHVHVAQFPDNGYYVSDSSLSGFGAGGDVHIESCYSLNNNITGFRIGGQNHTVTDSVSAVTDGSEVPVHANGGHNARCGRMENVSGNLYENVDFYQAEGWSVVQTKDGGSGTIRNSRLEGGDIDDDEGSIQLENVSRSGATTQAPAGVPMNPTQAAEGKSGGGGGPEPLPVDGETDLPVDEAQTNVETRVRDVHTGYTGPGFLDLEPRQGAHAEWPIDVQTSGEYDLTVRYSNGGDSERVGTLYAGSSDQAIAFPTTGSWNNWETLTVPVSLSGDDGVIGIETTGNDVGQIDTLSLSLADPCSDVTCGKCETCVDGNCVPVDDPCCGVSCDEGYVCENGDCVRPPDYNPCEDLVCGDCQKCVDGECVPVDDPCCGVSCGDCETCEGGDCVPVENPCCGVSCTDDERCEDGECVPATQTGGSMNPLLVLGALGAGAVAYYRGYRGDDQ